MGLRGFIRSRAPQIAVLAALEALLALVLCVAASSADLVALVMLLCALASSAALALDYVRDRAFWRSLAELASAPDAAHAAAELMGDPASPEARVAAEAISHVSKCAADEVASRRRFVEEYRAYVETWVHEAKSPITAARLALANLEEDARAGEPAASAALGPRLRAVDGELARVERYVEQALFYARSESLDRDFLVRRHELREVASSAVRANASLLISAGVAPRLGEGLSLTVFTDDKWLSFMLGQLLQNSARYVRANSEGGSQVWFDARLLDEGKADERVELTVRDNGCGVSEADLPRVFDRGFTGENGRTREHSTGLGLWLVWRLASKMGVSVAVDSVAGEGFSVTLGFPANKMHYYE